MFVGDVWYHLLSPVRVWSHVTGIAVFLSRPSPANFNISLHHSQVYMYRKNIPLRTIASMACSCAKGVFLLRRKGLDLRQCFCNKICGDINFDIGRESYVVDILAHGTQYLQNGCANGRAAR